MTSNIRQKLALAAGIAFPVVATVALDFWVVHCLEPLVKPDFCSEQLDQSDRRS
jgi:hypothetical protein